MHRKKLIGAVIAVCAIAGVMAAIAQGSSSTKRASSPAHTSSAQPGPGRPGGGPGHGPGGDAVHSESVVLDKAGTAYITQTSDHGTVKSVDSGAGTVTIVEGTKSVPYKTLTLTVPSAATVVRDGKTSALSSLVAGDEVSVNSSSDGTLVFASDSSFHPDGGPGRGGWGGPMGPPPGHGPMGSSTSKGSSTSE